MILGVGQLGDTDRITPKHLGRNFSWIIAGTENNDLGAGDLPQQALEIAVCRNQDEAVSGGVLQNPAIRRREPARSEAHFRTRGTGPEIVEPASAIGFRRRVASSSGDFAPRRQIRCIGIHGKEVIRLQLRIIGQDLLLGRPT